MDFSKKKIMVVEDDGIARGYVVNVLASAGFSINNIIARGEVDDIYKAVSLTRKGVAPDIILCALSVAQRATRMGGPDVIRRIGNNLNIPIVLSVMSVSDKDVKEARKLSADGIIFYPFDRYYREVIEEALKEKKMKVGEGQVDKDVCLRIVDRMFRVVYHPIVTPPIEKAIFVGKARDYKLYVRADFQKFLKENNIKPDEEIVIWEDKSDVFRVVKRSEIS